MLELGKKEKKKNLCSCSHLWMGCSVCSAMLQLYPAECRKSQPALSLPRTKISMLPFFFSSKMSLSAQLSAWFLVKFCFMLFLSSPRDKLHFLPLFCTESVACVLNFGGVCRDMGRSKLSILLLISALIYGFYRNIKAHNKSRQSALGHMNCLSVWLLVVWMAYGLGQKKSDMWKCGIITSVLQEVLEKYFGGAKKSSKNWRIGVFWCALFNVSFCFRNTVVHTSQSLIYCHIRKYRYIAEQNFH